MSGGGSATAESLEQVEECVLAVARVDDDIQASLKQTVDIPDLASMSAHAFEDWLLAQAAATIESSFPQLRAVLPLIEARRAAVLRLEARLERERPTLRADDNDNDDDDDDEDGDGDDDDVRAKSANGKAKADTSAAGVAELKKAIDLRRSTAVLLKEATDALVQSAGKVSASSGDVELQRLVTSDAATRAALASGSSVLPELLRRIPSMTYSSLAEEHARNEQSVLTRLFNQRVDFLRASRVPLSLRWWGATVDLSHADVQLVFTGTSWLGSMTALLGKLLAGQPNALLLQVVLQFAAFYGVALAHIDRGRGIRFCVPWLAISPLPNPLLVVPTPL